MPDGNHNYGLKIIADTGDFQWSDQFGISNSVSTSSSSTPATAPTASKETVQEPSKAAKESAKAVKETAKAVKQASDGQIQEPTGTVEFKEHHTKNISNTVSHEPKTDHESKTHTLHLTHTKDHTAKPFATGNHLSAHLVQHEKGANATHIIKHQKSQVLPSIIATSAMESVTPTVAPSVPTTLPSTTVAPSTSLKSTLSAGGAVRAVATGVPLVLGAMAALVL